MDNTKLSYGILGLIMGIVLTLIVAPRWEYQGLGGMMGRTQIMNNIDGHFIEQMIPHHDDAIAMANIALQKAEHPEIRQLAEGIVKAQTEENNKMESWYEEWFGEDVPDTFAHMGHGMISGMMGDATDLLSLETARPFDKEFIEQMIPHHQMAVMMAQMLVATTQRNEMRDLGEQIIAAQNKEIAQMRSWYRDWY